MNFFVKRGGLVPVTGIILGLIVLQGVFTSDGDAGAQLKVQEFPYQRRLSRDDRKWIAEQVKRMRLEEKIGQMMIVPVGVSFHNIESPEFTEVRRQILENSVGGIVLSKGEIYQAVMLINRLQELARFPLLVAAELEAGAGSGLKGATEFPWTMAAGATGDPTWAEKVGAATAQEARLLGVNVILGPVADLSHPHSRDRIGTRAYGDDPDQVGQFAAAFIKGAQKYGMMAAVKHFPGYGEPESSQTPGVSRGQSKETGLVPFRAAISSQVGAVVVSPFAVPEFDQPGLSSDGGQAAPSRPFSAVMIANVLRRGMNFDGVIIADCGPLTDPSITMASGDAAVEAVKTGVDMLLRPARVDEAVRAIWQAVRQGEIKEERIDDSVMRILTAKVRLGLAYNRFTEIEIIDSVISRKETGQIAQDVAQRSLTLIRNQLNLVPLLRAKINSLAHIAVTDADLNRNEQLELGWTLTVELVRKGLKVNRIVVDASMSSERVPQLIESASAADGIIVSLFDARGAKDSSARLTDVGATLVSQLLKGDQPVIVIFFGSPYLLLEYPKIHTVLCAYGGPGEASFVQRAVAQALVGEEPITGRLPVDLPGLHPRGHGIAVETQKQEK